MNRFEKRTYLLASSEGKISVRTRGDAAAKRLVEVTSVWPRVQLYRCDARGRVYLGTYVRAVQQWTLLRELLEEDSE